MAENVSTWYVKTRLPWERGEYITMYNPQTRQSEIYDNHFYEPKPFFLDTLYRKLDSMLS